MGKKLSYMGCREEKGASIRENESSQKIFAPKIVVSRWPNFADFSTAQNCEKVTFSLILGQFSGQEKGIFF